jgi:hypothetical protein
LFAITEEKVGMAGGAKAGRENVFFSQSGGEELRAVCPDKVKMNVLGRRLVAWRHHVEPLERIGLFAGARFIEIFVSVGKLRRKLCDEVGANFIAARANAGADGGKKIEWI